MKRQKPAKPSGITTVKPPVKKEIKNFTSKTSSFDTVFEKHGLGITMGIVVLLILIVFFEFILGNKYYLFKDIGSDSLNIALPQLHLLTTYFHSEGWPVWSFAQGMGQNIMPNLSDPFAWIVILSGQNNVMYSFILMELVKMILTSIFFFQFLTQLKLSGMTKVIGTILYTFSGFIVIGSEWNIFSAEACLFALLLLGFEMVYSKNSWYLFPVAIAAIAMLQPFDLYLYGLFLILYFLLRHFSSDNSWRKFILDALKLIFLAFIGIIISSFFLVSTVQMLLDSPRVGGNSSYTNKLLAHPLFTPEGSMHNMTTILRFFANDILGNGSNFKGWYNYLEAPLVYIGLLPLLLFPQIFYFADRRKRVIYGVFLAIFIIPVIFPFFRYAFWLFTGDYYRGFSLFISLSILLLSLFAINEIDKIKKVNLPVLVITFAFLMLLLFYPYNNVDQIIESGIRSIVVLFLIVYSAIILTLGYLKNRDILKVVLVLFVMIEVGYFNGKTLGDRVALTNQEAKSKSGYNDYTMEAIDYLKNHDKPFYRINKEYASGPAIHTSYNDAKIQGYYGTQSYASFNQKYYIRFLEEAGVIEKGVEFQSRWAPGITSRPFLHFTGSVKYNLTKTSNSQFLKFGYDSITQVGDVKILRNKYFLPLGFTYQRYLLLSDYRKLSDLQKQLVLLRAFVSEEPVPPSVQKLTKFNLSDTTKTYTWDELSKDVQALKRDTLQTTRFSNNHISGNLELKETKLLFFSVPFDKGWHGTINGKKADLILSNVGFIGLLLEPGKYVVELFYKPPFFYESLWATIAGLVIYAGLMFWKFLKDKKGNLSNS